jgi:DNA-binding MarR family transcriptional regulator
VASGNENGAYVWALNFRLSTGVLNDATIEIEELGIEAKEFFVLDGVDEQPYPAQIATRLAMSRPAVTLHLRNLERKGLLRREIDPVDLRRHRLILTEKGEDITAKARNVLSEKYAARLARLDGDERSEFSKLLEKLTE